MRKSRLVRRKETTLEAAGGLPDQRNRFSKGKGQRAKGQEESRADKPDRGVDGNTIVTSCRGHRGAGAHKAGIGPAPARCFVPPNHENIRSSAIPDCSRGEINEPNRSHTPSHKPPADLSHSCPTSPTWTLLILFPLNPCSRRRARHFLLPILTRYARSYMFTKSRTISFLLLLGFADHLQCRQLNTINPWPRTS